jgi:glycosyltransferase involved in cell wall biosynthesis
MACGTPVITSHVSSLPEVVGEAGLLVDPYNINELSEAISQVLTDENLRNNLKLKGVQKAKKFFWQKTARETLKIFESL